MFTKSEASALKADSAKRAAAKRGGMSAPATKPKTNFRAIARDLYPTAGRCPHCGAAGQDRHTCCSQCSSYIR